MTKQASPVKLNPAELLLRRYTKVEEVMEKCAAENRKRGLPEGFMRFYVDINKNVGRRRKYEMFLEQVCNNDGEFNTMQMLKATKAVRQEFNTNLDSVQYPIRELHGITRFKTSTGEEVIKTSEFWRALRVDGSEMGIGVQDLQMWYEPTIEEISPDPQLRIGYSHEPHSAENRRYTALVNDKSKKLLRCTNYDHTYTAVEQGTIHYTTPFNKENVESILSETTLRGPFGSFNGSTMSISRESVMATYTVTDMEEFCSPSFDDLWKLKSTIKPQVDLDELAKKLQPGVDVNTLKELINLMKGDGAGANVNTNKDNPKQDQYK